MVTFGNIRRQLIATRFFCCTLPENTKIVAVSWLPVFHDFGLITCLSSFVFGHSAVYISPQTFLQRPYMWLDILSKYKAHYSMVPDFAFTLAKKKWIEKYNDGKTNPDFDLTNICAIGSGGEPARRGTIQDFESYFSRFGLKPNVIRPGYGLAENVLVVSGAYGPKPLTYSSLSSYAPGLVGYPLP